MPWCVRRLLDLKSVLKNEMRKFELCLKPGFREKFKFNSRREETKNKFLLTIVFLFHAITGEAQIRVFYVTHALPFKTSTNSVGILFHHMLFGNLHLISKLRVAWWFY